MSEVCPINSCYLYDILFIFNRQHSETIHRCDHTMKELEYYRGQHIAAMNQLEAAAQESSTLRHKYSDLAAEKQRLDREVQNMQKEMCELRCQQQVYFPITSLFYKISTYIIIVTMRNIHLVY